MFKELFEDEEAMNRLSEDVKLGIAVLILLIIIF